MKILLIALFVVFLHFEPFGQTRCGVGLDAQPKAIDRFESWLNHLQSQKASRIDQSDVYTIPVVFHVVHSGEEEGTGVNIADERILQQIEILNEDFRRTNADTIDTPEEFKGFAADIGIEFVLAKQDPEGLPTTGITRTQGLLTEYNQLEFSILKSVICWPTEDYLNIYVANISGLIGWARFPFTNLAGISELSTTTDAVILDYEFVGINDNTGSFASFGRTATHEIGHFLGLRHVWGDGNCEADDFCSDTPASRFNYSGSCPSSQETSCNSSDMYSNYLYFTDDACMNLFTQCQRDRMRLVLENSPRRASLLSSPALLEPAMVNNDLGILSITEPLSGSCETEITPSILVRNYGTNTISQFAVQMQIAGVPVETINASSDLQVGQTTTVNFTPITLIEDEIVTFSITSVNGSSDGNNINNTGTVTVSNGSDGSLPYVLDFEEGFDNFSNKGTPDLRQVEQVFNDTANNHALKFAFFNEEQAFGETQYVILPNINLQGLSSAVLEFDYAYGTETGQEKDGLIVALSTDCGTTFPPQNYFLRGFSEQLVTTTRTITGEFAPLNDSEWNSISFNISNFLTIPDVRFAFLGVNGSGNNIYLDNIRIIANSLNANDLAIASAEIPVATCDESVDIQLTIRNTGFDSISSFQLNYEVAGESQSVTQAVAIPPGGSLDINDISANLPSGSFNASFTVSNPNGVPDENTENNSITRRFIIDDFNEDVPFRQTFDALGDWTLVNPNGETIGALEAFGDDQAVKFSTFLSPEDNDEHWLVSPNISTGTNHEISLVFDWAYALSVTRFDRLRVQISTDCGNTYPDVVFNRSGVELSTASNQSDFDATISENWEQAVIDLSSYTEFPEIRIAFVYSNEGGSDLYLDNIELIPSPAENIRQFADPLVVFPNPSSGNFNVTLNLAERQPVALEMVDISGKILVRFDIPLGLNQTFSFDAASQPGLHFIVLKGKNLEETKRVLLSR